MAMSLEQLKEENARVEAEAGKSPQDTEQEDEAGAAETETEATTTAESGESVTEDQVEAEPWMQSGDDDETDTESHDSEKKFTDGDMAATRRKFKGKLTGVKKENEELQKRIEALEKGHSPAAAPASATQAVTVQAKPQEEDFETVAEYVDALTDWKIANSAATQHAETEKQAQQRRIKDYEEQRDSAVEKHYERAVELAGKSKIAPEAYQEADRRVRLMAEEIFPEGGDAVIDDLIAKLGDGSEKVMFNLGVNTKRRSELRTKLKDDPSGLSASMYLGQLKMELSLPGKRRSTAPDPADDVKGDVKMSEAHRQLKRKYDAAHRDGNLQKAIDIKRQAKQAGADTSTWIK